MKRILLVAGDLNPVYSYEYHNFKLPFERMGHQVILFDFLAKIEQYGRQEMNTRLMSVVAENQPDLVFFVPQTDEFIPDMVQEIGKISPTFCYFFDDMWRIDYSRNWARYFHHVSTSDVNGVEKFRDAGVDNVIYSPFACNTRIYEKKDLDKCYDVSFVGQYHPHREWLLHLLKRSCLDVRVWGKGWPSGMIGQDEMVEVFNRSRVNLNLSNCVSWDVRYLLCPRKPLKSCVRALKQAVTAYRSSGMKTVEQVKGRHFEINACGGFQLSYYVEGLERQYFIGREIAIFSSPEDLVEKVVYFLSHPDERETIAGAGHARTLEEHTMEQRLGHIMQQTGMG